MTHLFPISSWVGVTVLQHRMEQPELCSAFVIRHPNAEQMIFHHYGPNPGNSLSTGLLDRLNFYATLAWVYHLQW